MKMLLDLWWIKSTIHIAYRAQNHHSFFDQLYIFEFRWVSVCVVVSISPDAIYWYNVTLSPGD